MDTIKVGEGENQSNDNGLGEEHCSCGIGGPHTLKCMMEQRGLRTVTMHFGSGTLDDHEKEHGTNADQNR